MSAVKLSFEQITPKASAETAAKPARCAECGHSAHVLIPHLEEAHGLSASAYLEKHGGDNGRAPLWSGLGFAELRKLHPGVRQAPRPRKRVPIQDAFRVGDSSGRPGDVEVFTTPGHRTPVRDPLFYFPMEQSLDVLAVLSRPARNRVYVRGWSGVGKTALIRQLACVVGANLVELNLDPFQQRSELVGRRQVKDGATTWQHGPIARAMIDGDWLLLNEFDAINPLAANILKPVLEDPPRLPIPETGEEIVAHPDFRVVSTNNTWARGDDSGLFVNVQVQSDADVRRWSAKISLDYMSELHETQMLAGYFPDVPVDDLIKRVKVANRVRDAFKAGKVGKTLSPAELVAWVDNDVSLGRGVLVAAEVSFLNGLDDGSRAGIREFIELVFGK